MPALFFQIISTSAQLVILLFIIYYLLHLRSKEKELKRKEGRTESIYRTVLEEALEREKKIINAATVKADTIIADAESMNHDSQKTLTAALQKVSNDMQKDASETATEFTKDYQASLKQLSTASLNDFQLIVKEMKNEITKETKDFHDLQLAALEKELEEYKQNRFKQIEQTVNRVIQNVSQEVLGSSISLDDHHKLLLESLEKAKKEGVFE